MGADAEGSQATGEAGLMVHCHVPTAEGTEEANGGRRQGCRAAARDAAGTEVRAAQSPGLHGKPGKLSTHLCNEQEHGGGQADGNDHVSEGAQVGAASGGGREERA